MNQIKFIAFVLTTSVLFSCSSAPSKNETSEFDSINLTLTAQKKEKAEFAKIDQDKALGEIKFNIGKAEFEAAKDSFMKKCLVSSDNKYGDEFNKYQIGGYKFNGIRGLLHNEKLYNIAVTGEPESYKYYDGYFPQQFKALMDVFVAKYGKPDSEYSLPAWTSLSEGYLKDCAIWQIGEKTIEVFVQSYGINYALNINIYQSKVVEAVEKEEREKEIKEAQKGTSVL